MEAITPPLFSARSKKAIMNAAAREYQNSRLPAGGIFLWDIFQITGIIPLNLKLYQQAFTHSSALLEGDSRPASNERLEFLGDAILSAVVAHYLYKLFPHKEEGELTEMRSNLVSRSQLNAHARELKLYRYVVQHKGSNRQAKWIYGNALEALVGAIYLDRGYKASYRFISKRLLRGVSHVEALNTQSKSSKSLLLEWAAKKGEKVYFEVESRKGSQHNPEFQIGFYLQGQRLAQGKGDTKKKAAEQAARRSLEVLHLSHE